MFQIVAQDFKSGAHALLDAIAAAADTALGAAETTIPTLTTNLLPKVETVVENLFPGPAKAIVTALATTADVTGHQNLLGGLEDWEKSLIAIGRANVAAALARLEEATAPSSKPAPSS